jgi:hypothetical protein
VNSPESTRPCHGCPENWNGTLDIAASGLEQNAPPVRHGAPLGNERGKTATELPATPLSARARPRSGRLAECHRNVSATFLPRVIWDSGARNK